MSAVQTNQTTSDNFLRVLCAAGRSAEISESADAYGWLVGSWKLEVLHYKGIDLASRNIKGEAHFSWVLEGRAIQDVWIMPRISGRTSDSDQANNMYGTTLRVWDPAIQAWRIRWVNPVSGHEERQTGRKVGDDIVPVGARPDGTPTRWRFTEITPGMFHGSAKFSNPMADPGRLKASFVPTASTSLGTTASHDSGANPYVSPSTPASRRDYMLFCM